MPAAVVGRDAELAALRDFLAGISDGAAAFFLEGDAGMGKTTLWSAGVAQAEARGLRVLRALPAESETELSFAGLGDLLDPVLADVLDVLVPAQRRALSRALVLDDDEGTSPDPHAVGVAVLNVLRAASADRPLLVAVDDAQWLDDASAGAVGYAARRLRDERVGLLLSRRSSVESIVAAAIRRSLPSERIRVIDVGPLDLEGLHALVRQHLDLAVPRPLLAEVQHASGGNPFFALEIARMLTRGEAAVDSGRQLPVPESLQELVRARLDALTPESRDFLLAAAAHAQPTTTIVEAATGVDPRAGLIPAIQAGIVEVDRDRIRFTHPLLAAGAYDVADFVRRKEIHARLAELLADPEARAWQLAASVDDPDETVASTLEDAAGHARARGALRPAALLLERARQLTPSERRPEQVRRAVEAAFLHFEAGDSRRAEAQLRHVLAPLEPGPERARALVVLARIRLYEAPDEAGELFEQVVGTAGADRQTLALAHEGLAACSVWRFERFDDALRHVDAALSLATELGDLTLAGDVQLVRLSAEALLGRPSTAATAEETRALQAAAMDVRILDQPLCSLAEYWIWIDEHDEARAALMDLLRTAEDLGDESARPWLLFLLGELELLVGNPEAGFERAREGREAAEQTGLPLFESRALALESLAHALRGRHEPARRVAAAVLEHGSDGFVALVASAALGALDLSLDRPGEVVEHLAAQTAFARREGIVEPGATRFVIDHVEALIALGRTLEAVELLEWYEGNARRLGRVSALANCARCRGLLEAQAGDLEAALPALAKALDQHAAVGLPLDHGRTLLALGATQRRLKRRREARATLGEALALFERIGAALWAERARAELKRISGRAASPGVLTPAEERVAALVAVGKTNKEVAAALYLSDRTVEGHLARIFGKLGIRQRTEVAGALQRRGIALPNMGDVPVSADPPAS
jgi:DNA-binding CsgD family transcriptional regulator